MEPKEDKIYVWGDSRRFNSYAGYFRRLFGERVQKVTIDAGFTCPNRDGTLDTGGCIFCHAGGSGDFAVDMAAVPTIPAQLAAGRKLFREKKTGNHFIAYFQAYTNTYGPVPYLRTIYEDALTEESVRGISIATRPDCLEEEILTLLVDIKRKFPDKFVWIELGLQTIHERTARFIRRGYDLPCFDNAVRMLHAASIPVIVHLIIGLPGESEQDVLATIDYLNHTGIWGVKLQLLHVLKGTGLETLFQNGTLSVLSKEAYLDILIHCLEHLSPETVVHRLTGDGAKELLLAPLWSLRKKEVLNSLHHEMKIRRTFQGRLN